MIKYFNYPNATNSDWKKLYKFVLDAKQTSSSDKKVEFEVWKKRWLSICKRRPYSSVYLLFDKNKIIATINAIVKNPGEKSEVLLIIYNCKDFDVLEKYQQQLLIHLNHLSKTFKSSTLTARHTIIDKIAKQANFTVSNQLIFFDLDLKKYKPNKKLLSKGAKSIKQGKLKFRFVSSASIEEYSKIAKLFTTLLNDIQCANKSRHYLVTANDLLANEKNILSKTLYLFLFDEKDNFIGMSVVSYPRKKPVIVNQYMTGVLKKYRKQGLSTWLKIKMYEKLKSELPKITNIKTDCYSKNLGIIRINKSLGFDTVKSELEYIYKNDN